MTIAPDAVEEGDRLTLPEPRRKRAQRLGPRGVECHDVRDPGRDRARLRGVVLGVVGKVCLRQHHHGNRPRVQRQREEAFKPRDVEVGVAGGDEEQRVDVRRDELPAVVGPRGLAGNLALPVEDAQDSPRVGIGQHPVADGGLAGGQGRGIAEGYRTVGTEAGCPVTLHAGQP